MSDGSLSQDEIDALLMGDSPLDMLSGNTAANSELGQAETTAVIDLLSGVSAAQSSALSGIMVKKVTLSTPRLNVVDREQFLKGLPDEVVEIQIPFKSAMTGSHSYILAGNDALNIASSMIGQEGLELNATSINALCEAMSQLAGVTVNAIGDVIGETILTSSAEGQNLPKALVNFPGNQFVHIGYDLEIEGNGSLTLNEIFDLQMIKTLTARLGVSTVQDAPAIDFSAAMGDPSSNQAAGGFQQMSPTSPMMGAVGAQSTLNVQGVQLPELNPSISAGEQRNISLLMDVSMELTVELGRTKWKIKDILGMGEGTIIELDKLAGEPVDILVNNNLIARGEVVVIDDNFGVRVTEIVSSVDRIVER